MSVSIYKLIHLIGIFAVLLGLGGMCFHAASGGTKGKDATSKLTGMLHGIGLFIVLLGGFGLIARLGESFASGWVIAKLLIWIVIGAAIAIPYRQPKNAIAVVFGVLLLAAIAGYLGINKPG